MMQVGRSGQASKLSGGCTDVTGKHRHIDSVTVLRLPDSPGHNVSKGFHKVRE